MSAIPVIGSAGRALGSAAGPRQLPAAATSAYSSFCLTCASWYFGENRSHCAKCGDTIFRWVRSEELRLFQSRTSLGGF